MWKTRVSELFNIDYPIVQGGMAWCSEAQLVGAVSNGGGLGVLGSGSAPANWVRDQIKRIRDLTDKPFGVNIMLMNPCAEEIADVIVEEKVPAVFTGAGSPAPFFPIWKEAGTIIVPVVPTVALAKRMQQMGAHAVVAEGSEAGGHIGELNTMTLVPQVFDALDIPVIAAGGIADGRGIAAAFMLGAEGIQAGTRFLCASENPIHENYKNKIVSVGDTDTIVTGRSTGAPVRAIKNRFSRKFQEMEKNGMTLEEFEAFGAGALRKAATEGEVTWGSVMAGQSAGMVKKIQPAAEIISEMASQAMALLKI